MSEFEYLNVLTVIAGISVAAFVALPMLFHFAVPTDRGGMREVWRDKAPLIFRFARWGIVRFARYIDTRLSSGHRAAILRKLQEAGLAYAILPAELLVVRWALVISALALTIYLVVAYGWWQPAALLPIVGVPVLAYFYLDIWLSDAAKRRKQKIEKEFPFFLDVVVLSMKAGLAFPAALQQAVAQLPAGPLQQELARLIRDVRTGVSRRDAVQHLAERVRLASISNFVAVIIQAEESGSSLTKTLNEQGKQRRRERFQRAEKLANQAPVKLLFPLVAFLFPVTFMIIGFPLYEQLVASGFLGGG